MYDHYRVLCMFFMPWMFQKLFRLVDFIVIKELVLVHFCLRPNADEFLCC